METTQVTAYSKQLKYYSNPDNDNRGDWNSATYTCNKTREERPNLYYPIVNPKTGKEVLPKETAVWKYSKSQTEVFQEDNRLFWGVDGTAKMPRIKNFYLNMKVLLIELFGIMTM